VQPSKSFYFIHLDFVVLIDLNKIKFRDYIRLQEELSNQSVFAIFEGDYDIRKYASDNHMSQSTLKQILIRKL
jgi:hypothetical protein